MEGKIDDKRR